MKRSRMVAVMVVMALCAGAAMARRAGAAESEKEKAKRIKLAWDFGDRKPDVEKYPKEIQGYYKEFAQQCSQCHDLVRPLNSPYAQKPEWQRYVMRMMHKPGCEMTEEKAKHIFKFLVHDSTVRKLGPDGKMTADWKAYVEKELPARYKKETGREWKGTPAALAGK